MVDHRQQLGRQGVQVHLVAKAGAEPLDGQGRVQQTVDLRFNRRKYDAALTIERFSARLRDQVDLDTLSAELLAVVDHTMRPTATSLWLRPSATDAAPAAPFARVRVG